MMYHVLHVLDAYEYGDWLEPNFLETQAQIWKKSFAELKANGETQ